MKRLVFALMLPTVLFAQRFSYPGMSPVRTPIVTNAFDSTSSIDAMRMLIRGDTTKMIGTREIDPDNRNYRFFWQVKTQKDYASASTYSGLRAVSAGGDSAITLYGAGTNGELFGSGRRLSGTGYPTGTFNRFFKFLNDSAVFFIDAVDMTKFSSTGLRQFSNVTAKNRTTADVAQLQADQTDTQVNDAAELYLSLSANTQKHFLFRHRQTDITDNASQFEFLAPDGTTDLTWGRDGIFTFGGSPKDGIAPLQIALANSASDRPFVELVHTGIAGWRLGVGGNAQPNFYIGAASETDQKFAITTTGNVGIGTTGPASKLDVTTTALGTTQTNTSGLALVNTTAAAAGLQQISPAQRFRGFGWKTDATAASQPVDFRSYVLPIQGAAAPTGELKWQAAVNDGAYTELMSLSSGGSLDVQGDLIEGNRFRVPTSSATALATGFLGLQFGSAAGIGEIASEQNLNFYVDYDNNGTNTWNFVNSTSGTALSLTESGNANLLRNLKTGGHQYLATQFDKTNTTLAAITGLSVNVDASKKYRFKIVLHLTADATGGYQFDMGGGTATATAVTYQCHAINNGTDAFTLVFRGTTLTTALGASLGTEVYAEIEGTINVNVAGTLQARFAQNSASGTSSVLVGSHMEVFELN